MFDCKVCGKKFDTLDEYAKHIMEENEKDKKEKKESAEKERLAKIQELKKNIEATYSKLKELVNTYNKDNNDKYWCELEHMDDKIKNDKLVNELFRIFGL